MKKIQVALSVALLCYNISTEATIYNVTTQTAFDNAISLSASSVTDNTINVNVLSGVGVLTPETFPGNPPHALILNVNGIDPSGITSFNINSPVVLQANNATLLNPNTSNVNMAVNSSLTQNGGVVTANGNSTITVGNTGSYALNGGILQLGNNNPLTTLGGQFSLGGGTLQVINSDLTLNLDMSLTLNSVSTIDTNNFNATLSGTVSSPAATTPAFVKIGNGTLTLSNYNLIGNGEQHVNGGNLLVKGNTNIHYLSLGSSSGPSVVADFNDPTMALTFRKTTPGGEAAVFQIGDFSTQAIVNQTTGTVSLLGAAMNVSNQTGQGVYNLSGGSIIVTSDPNFPSTRAFFTLGRNTGTHLPTNGVLNLSGTGLIDVSSPSSLNALILGSLVPATLGSSTGELNQSGGTLRIHNGGQFYLSGFGDGLYNFTGGSLEIGGTNSLTSGFGGGSGTYQFNFGGGTIKVIESDFITDVNMTLLASSISTIDTNSFNATLTGQLTGSGTLRKTNQGILTLSGANTYSGGTQLSSGTLLLANNMGLGTGTLDMFNGTTLSLNTGIDAANAINLTGSDTIEVPAGSSTLSGSIAGSGSLIKSGAGILNLSGSNNYVGGTLIDSGTLAMIGSGSLLTTGPLTINNGATFDISGLTTNSLTIGDLSGVAGSTILLGSNNLTAGTSDNSSFAGTLSGLNGSFTKNGSGSLLLSGISSYNGPTSINQGTLLVNGTIANSTATVATGAFLRGTGTLANVILNGTVQPGDPSGNSIGTLTASSFHFMNGSQLINEIDANGSSDLLNGTTSVTIDPGVNLNVALDPGSYTPGTTYVFIESPGVTGTFTNVTANYPRFKPEVQYFIDHVQLILTTNDFVTLLPSNATKNEIKVAQYLDQLEAEGAVIPGSDLASVFSILSFATSEELAQSLNTFHPAPYNALLVAEEYAMLKYSLTLVNRLNELTSCSCRNSEQSKFWITPFGSYSKQRHTRNQVGYRDSTKGIAFGLDRFIRNNVCLGITGGYTKNQVHWVQTSGRGTIQTGYAGLYGRYFNEKYYVDGNIFAALSHNKAKRKVFAQSILGTINRSAHSTYQGYNYNSYLGIGREIENLPFNLNLVASLDWAHLYQESIKEKGASSLNLHVRGKDANLLRSQFGFIISKCLYNLVPELGFFCAYDTRFNGAKFTSNFRGSPGNFATYGLSPSRFLVLPQIKISSCFLDDKLSFSLCYEAEISNKYYDHSGLLSIAYNF